MSGSPSPEQARIEAEQKYGPKLPGAVTRQIAAAEALYTPQDPQSAASAAETEPSAPASTSVPAGPPEGHQPPAAGEEADWEQRFRSAQGRLEQLQARESSANERIEALQRTVAAMQARGQTFDETQPAQPFERLRLITEEEENDYGKDLISVTKKAAREELTPEVETLAQRIARLEGRVEGASQVIARNEVQGTWSFLNQHIPNWNDINHHPDFKERYLAQRDPASGRLRRELIREAFDTHDAQRVLHFFQGYLSEATGTPSQPQPSPPPPTGNGADPLLAYAAPGRARSEPQPALPPGKPTYTRAQMSKFWDDRRRGLWRGRETDADAIENDIFRAQHEGRIVG